MRAVVRLATVLVVFLGVAVVDLPASHAVGVPQTLADRRPVGLGAVEPPFSIDHLGVLWDTEQEHEEHPAHSEDEHGEARFRIDGRWTAWQPLVEDGANAPGQWASALLPAGGAEAYQVRGVPADAGAPRAVALNTTDGPLVEVGRRPAGGTAQALANCLSRKQWGADESLRFDRRGNEIWPPEFYPVQTMTVHHTATKNSDPDPAATVRAIYRYHAVDRGWGDIGYHYLIDEQGRVYEGRWSGEESAPCGSSGGGTDFAHDPTDELVTAGHTGGYNSGNVGAAVLGTFTTASDPSPTALAVDALEGLLAESATRHTLDPHAIVDYVNPADPSKTNSDVPMISGHKDWTATECPGANLYAMLPAIRDAVAAQLDTLSVSISSPADGGTVAGTVSVTATAPKATSVTFHADGALLGTDTDKLDGWSATWDTAALVEDSSHTLTATASDGTATVSSSVSVIVDNVTVTNVDPASGKQGTTVKVTITGSGFVQGATVDLQNGNGTEPVVSGVSVASPTSLTATFTIGRTAGLRKDLWDVAVINPASDGRSAVLLDGFTVLR